jgi:hypothetical protein
VAQGTEGYKNREARKRRKKGRRTRYFKDTWDANNGMYEVYGSPFNAPPMTNEVRHQDIKTTFEAASPIFGAAWLAQQEKQTFKVSAKKFRLTGSKLTEK